MSNCFLGFAFGVMLCSACDAGGAIIYPTAPANGHQIVIESTSRDLKGNSQFLGGLKIQDLTVAAPYRRYYVGSRDLAAGRLLSAAKAGEWLYLLMHGPAAAGAAGLKSAINDAEAPRFNALYRTNFSDESLEAFRIAARLPQVQKQDYELRRLDIPEESFVAIWLHGKSGDIIIPLPPTFGRMSAYRPCSEQQIIETMQAAAKKVVSDPHAK